MFTFVLRISTHLKRFGLIQNENFVHPIDLSRKRDCKALLSDWRPRINGSDSSILELKVYRLDTNDLQLNIPKGDEQRFWYCIHFVSSLRGMRRNKIPSNYSPLLLYSIQISSL